MNKDKKYLLRYELIIDYFKNNNRTELYRRTTDNTVIDNEILDNLEDTLFITTLNKYNELQQENKHLQEQLNQALKDYENELKKNEFLIERDNKCQMLEQENKQLKEENERLINTYKSLIKRQYELGNNEFARYLQAQIDENNTFTVGDK